MELTGAGTGHAAAADFSGSTRGTITLVNTASALFRVGIARDGTLEPRESFRVRLSDLRAPDNFRLSAAGSAVMGVIAASDGIDYDTDNDNLIEVERRAQLSAIRHDLGGGGRTSVAGGDLATYDSAFPDFDEGETCPGSCAGYELSNDIDLSGSNWNPIGGGAPSQVPLPEAERYNAVLEGNGYVIENMTIASGNRWDFVGLFRALGEAGVIRNVGLVDVDVRVPANSVLTGALAGIAYGRIASSYVAGGRVHGGWGIGGLAGELAAATVVASYADVSVDSPNRPLGGLAGRASGMSIVSASYTVATLRRSGSQVGALVGDRGTSAEIQSSYFDRGRAGLEFMLWHERAVFGQCAQDVR